MNTSLLFTTLISIACFISTSLSQERTDAALTDHPFRWLEDIEGPAAVAWVRADNEKTLGVLQSDPRYPHYYEQALSILQKIGSQKFHWKGGVWSISGKTRTRCAASGGAPRVRAIVAKTQSGKRSSTWTRWRSP